MATRFFLGINIVAARGGIDAGADRQANETLPTVPLPLTPSAPCRGHSARFLPSARGGRPWGKSSLTVL
jgi:hypothetical protein